jgi:TolB-like protein
LLISLVFAGLGGARSRSISGLSPGVHRSNSCRPKRLERARRKLVRAPPGAGVTGIAVECGFRHLGRFSLSYRDRYGESPSATLRYSQVANGGGSRPFPAMVLHDRPTIAILPFDLIGSEAGSSADLHHDIAITFGRAGWARIVPSPAGHYHLHGALRADGAGKLRVRVMLLDRSVGSYIWADRWECAAGDPLQFQEWLSGTIARALRSVVRDAEMAEASRREPEELTAWQLTMRALPLVLATDSTAHGCALEFLDRAIELSPSAPLPIALAAFCRGLRAAHHLAKGPEAERESGLGLAVRASLLGITDPVDREEAYRAFEVSQRSFPDLTISQVRAGIANTPQWMDRLAEGLESLGMPVS